MTTQEIADARVELCSQGQFRRAIETLYGPQEVAISRVDDGKIVYEEFLYSM